MSPENDNNSRPEEQNSVFSAYIAKATKIAVKIRDINNIIANKYKVQPLLVLIPFTAGILASTLLINPGNSNDQQVFINSADLSGSLLPANSGTNNTVQLSTDNLFAKAGEPVKNADNNSKDPDKKTNSLDIPEEMKNELKPEEILIFEKFSQLAEIQEEKGMESEEAAKISSELDVLINDLKIKQEAESKADQDQILEENEDNQELIDAEKILNDDTDTEKKETKVSRFKPRKPSKPVLTRKPENLKTKEPVVPAKLENNTTTTKLSNTLLDGPPTPKPVKEKVSETAKTESKVTPVIKPVSTTEKPDSKIEDNSATEQPESDVLDEGKIRIKTNDGIIDLNELLITIGKELELNYYFEDGAIPTGNIMLQQYGAIDRSELLPLLESVLAKANYMMVKEGPYTKIVKRADVHKTTSTFKPELDDNYEQMDDSVVTTIVTIEHISLESLGKILEKFIPYTDCLTAIENTNKVVITEYAPNLERILSIIQMVDVPGPEKNLEIITPNYLKPDNAKSIIEEMYNKLYGESGITNSPSGSKEPAPQEQDISKMSPAQKSAYLRSRNQAKTKSNTAKNEPAAVVGPDISVDKRTGRMFIIGTESELANVKSILALFDVPKSGPQAAWEIYTPDYVDSKNVVSQIEVLMKAMTDEDSGLNPDAEDDTPSIETQNTTPQPTRGRPTNNTRTNTNTSSAGSNEIQGMFIHVDERTNRIIVLGWPDQIELFEKLLALFDIPLPGGDIVLEIIPLENTEASDTVNVVKELISAITKQSSGKAPGSDKTSSRGQSNRTQQRQSNNNNNQARETSSTNSTEEDTGPFMLADERLNRIFIIGVAEEIEQAKELTQMIDQQWPGSKVRLEILTFDVVEVEAITEQITELIEALNNNEGDDSGSRTKRNSQSNFPGMSNAVRNGQTGNNNSNTTGSFQQAGDDGPFLMADNRLNRLFVVGLDDQIEQVIELKNMLDKSIGLELNILPAFQYILSSDAADQISKLMSVMHEQEIQDNSSSSSNRNRNRNRNNQSNNRLNNITDSSSSTSSNNTRSSSSSTEREGISSVISVSQRGPFLLPDDRTNRLLIVSTKEQYNEVVDLIPVLDIPPSKIDEMTIEIYEPQYVTVTDVQNILESLGLTTPSETLDEKYRRRGDDNSDNSRRYANNNNQDYTRRQTEVIVRTDETMIGNVEEPDIYVAAHESSNRIFIYAAKYQHEEIARMIEKIDIKPDDNLGDFQVFSLKHQKPETIAATLNELIVDSGDAAEQEREEIVGKSVITSIEDTSFIVVKAPQHKRDQIAKLIEELDKAMPQILIEAKFIQISLDDSFKLGIGLQESFDTGNGSVSGISPLNLGEITTNSQNVAIGSGGTIAFFHDDTIKATMEALATQTNSEVTSEPRLLVSNNGEATFTSTKQKATTVTTIPAGSDSPITEFDEYIEAGTTLTITPQIGIADKDSDKNDASFISMDVTVEVDSFEGEGEEGIPPDKSTNKITTSILIPDGATIIMGGLTQTSWSDSVNKIPLLGDIPGLGVLFRNTTKSKTKTVLYLFIKATVAFDPNKDPDFKVLKKLSKIDQEEMNELRESFNEMPVIPGFNDNKAKKKALESK